MRAPRAFCAAAVFFGLGLLHLRGADFEVINTADNGFGSLRQAIEDANDNPGADRIVFNIPGVGVQRIVPVTVLPPITGALQVDGYSQPGATPNSLSNGFNGVLLIQLDGVRLTGAMTTGLELKGGASTLRGLVVTRFPVGIQISSSSNVVAGNLIGLDPTGKTAMGNVEGIMTGGDCCTVIGGLAPADRNVIAGNPSGCVRVGELPNPPLAGALVSTNLSVLGNFVGTDSTGLVPVPLNPISAPFSVRGAENMIVGNLAPGGGNVIATGIFGFTLRYPITIRIVGNQIGVGVDGHTPLRNTNAAWGISAVSNTWIEANTIAFTGTAVSLWGAKVSILSNRIYSNGVAGISFGSQAPPNDVGDLDTGPNELQNYPTLTAAIDGPDLILTGELQSKPDTTYTVQFFASTSRNTNGVVEGELMLGSTQLSTPTSGTAHFEYRYPNPGFSFAWITATATDPQGNTSLFSPGARVRSTASLLFQEQPANVTVSNGLTAIFRVVAAGAEPITYQWRRNGVNLAGANSSILTLQNVRPEQAGTYDVVASNPFGTLTSESARLTVILQPVFLFQPISQTVAPGEWVTVSVGLSPFTTPPIGIRWRSNGTFFPWMAGTQYNSFFTFRSGSVTANLSVQVTNTVARFGVFSSIAAIKSAPDRDQDGLPDDYETGVDLDPDDPADASHDGDGDRVTALQEYLAGTDPQDPSSRLEVDRLELVNGAAALVFAAVSNRTYRIQYQDEPGPNPWLTLLDLPARQTNGPASIVDPLRAGHRFYRVLTPARP